jgi:hypothetical protein
VTMNHPEAGPLELWREKLPIGDSGGQLLVLYHAEPGSHSAAALAGLAPAATALTGAAPASGPAVGDASRRRARRTPQ